jgi:type I pantothenate kinase
MDGPTTPTGVQQLAALVAARVPAHGAASSTTIVGLGGGVAAGKSRLAEELAEVLVAEHRIDVLVVASDGFLLPNRELQHRGLLDCKGFPESYDVDAIDAFLTDVRAGQEMLELPVYDHLLYDVLDERRPGLRAAVLVFEGVNVLHFADRLDVAVYLDATEADLRRWFAERVLQLRTLAAGVPDAYLAPVADWDDDVVTEMAGAVWDAVNGPNLQQHIEPTRERADIVVTKASDHSLTEVRVC